MEPPLLEIEVRTLEPGPVAGRDAGPDGGSAASSTAPARRHVARVRGDVDVDSARELAAVLDDLLSAGTDGIVIDADEITFIDSSGVRVLVETDARLDASGARLVVDPMSLPVRRVLQIAGLYDRYCAA